MRPRAESRKLFVHSNVHLWAIIYTRLLDAYTHKTYLIVKRENVDSASVNLLSSKMQYNMTANRPKCFN